MTVGGCVRFGWCLLALLGADDKIPGRGRLQVGLASGWVNRLLGQCFVLPFEELQ